MEQSVLLTVEEALHMSWAGPIWLLSDPHPAARLQMAGTAGVIFLMTESPSKGVGFWALSLRAATDVSDIHAGS